MPLYTKTLDDFLFLPANDHNGYEALRWLTFLQYQDNDLNASNLNPSNIDTRAGERRLPAVYKLLKRAKQ